MTRTQKCMFPKDLETFIVSSIEILNTELIQFWEKLSWDKKVWKSYVSS